MSAPTYAQIIRALRENAGVLRRSYSDTNGEITDPAVAREIACMAAAIRIIQRESASSRRRLRN